MKYRAIREHSRHYLIRLMCRELAVSPAGYYAWRDRPESRRVVYYRILLSEIRVIHRESREPYGSPSIWVVLMKRGYGVGEHRITRHIRVAGIRAKTVKKWRATIDSEHMWPVAPNTTPSTGSSRSSSPTGCGPGPSPTCGPPRAGSISPWCSIYIRAR